MPLTNDEAIAILQELLEREERDWAWVARKVGKSYQWVARRFKGVTPMHVDDYGLLLQALQGELVSV